MTTPFLYKPIPAVRWLLTMLLMEIAPWRASANSDAVKHAQLIDLGFIFPYFDQPFTQLTVAGEVAAMTAMDEIRQTIEAMTTAKATGK